MDNYKEKRKYERYGTEAEIFFSVSYDIKTVVKFQVVEERKTTDKKYSALSRDISIEGLNFTSDKKLKKGDLLLIELYPPGSKEPVYMGGEVAWCQPLPYKKDGKEIYQAGIKLISVNGKSVADSIYFDEKYQVMWSVVLESVFGSFRLFVQKLKQSNAPQ